MDTAFPGSETPSTFFLPFFYQRRSVGKCRRRPIFNNAARVAVIDRGWLLLNDAKRRSRNAPYNT